MLVHIPSHVDMNVKEKAKICPKLNSLYSGSVLLPLAFSSSSSRPLCALDCRGSSFPVHPSPSHAHEGLCMLHSRLRSIAAFRFQEWLDDGLPNTGAFGTQQVIHRPSYLKDPRTDVCWRSSNSGTPSLTMNTAREVASFREIVLFKVDQVSASDSPAQP